MSVSNDVNIRHEIVYNHKNLPNWKLNVLYVNARSILAKGKFDKLKEILKNIEHKVHIILITETWFKKDSDAETVNITDFIHFYNFRDGKKGGGISIYARKYLEPQLTAEKYKLKTNYLWVHLVDANLNIGVIYKPELKADELNTFLEVFSTHLKERPRAVVFGDFNLDLLESVRKTNSYKETVKEAGFILLNVVDREYVTRKTETTGTIIDHVFTNLNEYEFHFSVIRSLALSDHYHLYLAISGNNFEVNDKDDIEPNAVEPAQMSSSRGDNSSARPIQNRRHTADETAQASRLVPNPMSARGDNSSARPIQNRRPTSDEPVPISDEDEDVLEDSRASGAGGRVVRRRRRVDIEYTCPRCLQIFDDSTNYMRHLRDDHQFSGTVEEKYAKRKCPHCGAIRLKQNVYNKHIQEFHADLMSRCPVTSTAVTSSITASTSAQVSSNNVPTTRTVLAVTNSSTTAHTSAVQVSSNNGPTTRTVPVAVSSAASGYWSRPNAPPAK